jgi:hypothetical protein
MLEKQQQDALRDEARDAVPRLPVSLSGEINAATRYAFPLAMVDSKSESRLLTIHL